MFTVIQYIKPGNQILCIVIWEPDFMYLINVNILGFSCIPPDVNLVVQLQVLVYVLKTTATG